MEADGIVDGTDHTEEKCFDHVRTFHRNVTLNLKDRFAESFNKFSANKFHDQTEDKQWQLSKCIIAER